MPIARRDPAAPIPLTPAQARLWFLDRAGPGGASYVCWTFQRLTGPLDTDALRAAFTAVVGRHEALRLVIVEGPAQVVRESGPELRVVDAPDEERARDIVRDVLSRRFTLDGAPLHRAVLVRLAADEHILSWCLHHIMCDAPSLGILEEDLWAHYRVLVEGEEPPGPVSAQFPDYAAWLAGQDEAGREAGLAHWREHLSGAPAVTTLPQDRARPREPVLGGARRSLRLPADLTADLYALVRARRVTPFVIVMSAMTATLARCSDEEDVVVGTALVNRHLIELEGSVGCYINLIPVRTDLRADPTLAELLRAVRGSVIRGLGHQATPFEEIADLAGAPRDLRRNPVFQTLLVMGEGGGSAERAANITVETWELDESSPGARFDLTLVVSAGERGIELHADYSADLYDEDTVDRFLRHVVVFLSAFTATPDLRVWEIPLHDEAHHPATPDASYGGFSRGERSLDGGTSDGGLSGGERSPGGTSDGGPEPRDPRSAGDFTAVHDLIARWAAEAPTAPALVSEAGTIGYGELERRSARLAARLREAGAGRESVVAVVLPNGGDAVVALLAALKAGAAYLPLNPADPPDRIAGILLEAGAVAAVTSDGHRDALAGYLGAVLTVGASGDVGDAEGAEGFEDGEGVKDGGVGGEHGAMRGSGRPAGDPGDAGSPDDTGDLGEVPSVGPEDLAYVIYTSGSTGRPKGVMVTHGTLARLTEAFRVVHGFGPGGRVLMLPPLTFDASVGDVFPALCSGAAVVLHPDPVLLDGPELVRFCARHGVTAVDTAASLWRGWAAVLAPGAVPADWPVTTMMVGGERVPLWAVRAWAAATGGRVELFNHYGPTEATVCATVHRTRDGAEAAGREHLPIGRPLPHVRAYVLDRRGGLAPTGTPGELHLGGDCLARGYVARPEETAARFVRDPHAGREGARMYRTGDLARYLADGTLEFLGRADRQLKVNGYRIEPAEVESAVVAHPGVRDAAVVASPEGDRLIGYVAPRTADPEELRGFLRERLPRHMVPAVLVPLDEIPRTPHGKIDTGRLPAASRDAPGHVPPRGPLETALAGVWARILGVPRVGRHDNFFALGGSSLLAARVLGEVREEAGAEISLGALFEAADLAELAASAATPEPALGDDDLRALAVLPGDVRDALGLTRGVRRDAREVSGVAGDERGASGVPGDAPGTSGPVSGVRGNAHGVSGFASGARGVPGSIGSAPGGAAAKWPGRVLLTGATGLLGAHLLAELLDRGVPEVMCLVRARDEHAATDRVREVLTRHGLWRPGYRERVTGLAGDLTAPRLGLEPDVYDAVAEGSDLICHAGRVVNFVQPYRMLGPVNVGGTVEMVRLAAHLRPTPLHTVSTLGVYLGWAGRDRPITEDEAPDDPAGLGSPYYQSRWVADAAARRAREHGLPVTVHRPARVGGHSLTGRGDPGDYFNRLLATFVQLRMVPDIPVTEDVIPVDHLAAAIAARLLDPRSAGRDFHYFDAEGITYRQMAAALLDHGYDVERVSWERWRAEILRRSAEGEPVAMGPFAADLGEEPPGPRGPRFDCSFACPPPDPTLIGRYLAFLETSLGAFPEASPGIPAGAFPEASSGTPTGAPAGPFAEKSTGTSGERPTELFVDTSSEMYEEGGFR
ncbi:non-ribosomal peptide synthetase [Streptosporangium sp. NBC_01469]|uniref:non-ribosomal peptide synthetase n=1 Tax=Streptosporangium sp. NBC_01469 TaxID=2903898 RepID=UPI002E2C5418|nr:non-ribosomal peptide synthetase [Streptosporangium sp. NBC_01469]